MRRSTQESERRLSASGKDRLTHRRYPKGRLLTPSGGAGFTPVADWERGLDGALCGRKARTTLKEALILVFRLKGKCCAEAAAGSRRTGLVMSEPFRPYEKLVEITVFGKKFQVPERNSLLRCFQFISPETIPYGRFCWNQDCQYCRVTCQLPDEDEPHEMLSCKFIVMPGMEVTEMSQELKWCLRAKLPADTPVSS